MLVDFPNYSHSNPWQIKTIQTSSQMDVKLSNSLELQNCYAFHISWEDIIIRDCDTLHKSDEMIARFEEFIRAQSQRSKIIWTVHNLTSHTYELKSAEHKLRSVIMEYASTINLMSMKHAFIIPDKHKSKINIVPHYIEHGRFSEIPKNKGLTFFKYGANRGRKDNNFYLKILNEPKINKFVSDARLNVEIDNEQTVVTKRRFSFLEAELYAQLSNFSTFYQEQKFNSGVLNFLIGNKLAVFHDKKSAAYMDLPDSFCNYCIELEKIESLNMEDIESLIAIDRNDIDHFVSQRTPKKVSNAFWKGVRE